MSSAVAATNRTNGFMVCSLVRGLLSGSFPDIHLKAKPVPKGKCDFQAKIAGWKNWTENVDECVYENVYGNTFLYAVQNTKGPAEAEPKNLQQKRRRLLGGLPRSLCSLAMTFQGLTVTTGERRDRACTGQSEPPSRQPYGCTATKANAATVLARALLSRRADDL